MLEQTNWYFSFTVHLLFKQTNWSLFSLYCTLVIPSDFKNDKNQKIMFFGDIYCISSVSYFNRKTYRYHYGARHSTSRAVWYTLRFKPVSIDNCIMRACSTDDICTHTTHMLYTITMENWKWSCFLSLYSIVPGPSHVLSCSQKHKCVPNPGVIRFGLGRDAAAENLKVHPYIHQFF